MTYFNGVGHTTVANGTTCQLGTVILSSNNSFIESDRYNIKTSVPEHDTNYFMYAGMQPEQSMFPSFNQLVNSEAEKSAAEEALKAARSEVSCSIGELITVGEDFTPEKVQECIQMVSASIPRMRYRTHTSYTTVLAFSCHLPFLQHLVY